MNQSKLFVNGKQKIKMKKNAMDPVDFAEEKRKDPKYKSELCKKFMETGFCVYGNKCRFAHGRHELMSNPKSINYKKKMCKSFQETGFCPYGSRCNFKHDERKLSDINLPYFYVNLFIKNEIHSGKRLQCFEDITSDTCSTSTLSNENSFNYEHKNSSEEEESNEEFNCTNSVLNFIM